MNRVLIRNCRYLVCRAELEGIIENGAVYIEGQRIVAVGPSSQIEAQFGAQPGIVVLDARDKLVMPGLVDAHTHVGEAHTLLVPGWLPDPITGVVDAMDRMYWPAYDWLTEERAYELTLLGLVNVLKHGATTHADAMIFPEAIYRASIEAGARTVIQPQMITSVALPDACSEEEYLAHTEAAIRNHHGASDGLVRVSVHPNAIFNSITSFLRRAMDLAQKYGVKFATHAAESPDEKERSDALWASGGGLVEHMRHLGLLGPQTVLFHGTLLCEREIDVLAETGTALVHCPATNAWFGCCAYLPYMLAAGLRVGLGTDCATHNLYNVMLSVLQHHNIMPRPLRGIDPQTIFDLATMGGARVLGWEDDIGNLTPGKRADIITIDLSHNTNLFPLNRDTLFWALASNGAGAETSDVLIDGVFVRRNGQFVALDEEAIIARAGELCEAFARDYHATALAGSRPFRRIHPEFER